ncbi:hypothetical protein Ancab_000383 [Ancistrocladus abbreviatus]
MASDDQFSFPIISNQLSQFTQSSSSLWRISSRVYNHEDNAIGFDIDSRSIDEAFLATEQLEEEVDGYGKEGDLEEKMDMLWEDFNQEERAQDEARGTNLCIKQASTPLRPSEGKGMRSAKRPRMVVVAALKLLKKLHLTQK